MKNIEKIEKATKKLENIVAEEGYENLIKAIMLCVMKGGFVGYKPTKKEYTVNVRFLDNNNHEKESMANVCLIGRAKLTEENGTSKLVLNLKPMYRNGNAVGVISQLYTYKNDGDKVKGNVLEKDNVLAIVE